jgi:mRNA interferase RelE/StbE
MPDHDEDRYRLRISRPAVVALTATLPEKAAHAAYTFITGPLLLNPHRVGKPLNPPLAGAYSARRGDYRILYFIDDDSKTVSVTAIAHRSNAYRT